MDGFFHGAAFGIVDEIVPFIGVVLPDSVDVLVAGLRPAVLTVGVDALSVDFPGRCCFVPLEILDLGYAPFVVEVFTVRASTDAWPI